MSLVSAPASQECVEVVAPSPGREAGWSRVDAVLSLGVIAAVAALWIYFS